MIVRLTTLLLLLAPSLSRAHPLDEAYDRTIVVHVNPRGLVVDYTLEVNPQFAVEDVTRGLTLKELGKVAGREALYERFCKDKVLEIAGNLLARMSRKITLAFSDVPIRLRLGKRTGNSLHAYMLAEMKGGDRFGEFFR